MTISQTPCHVFDYSNKCQSPTVVNLLTFIFDTYIPARVKSLLKRFKSAFTGILMFHKELDIIHINRYKNGL